MDPVQNVAEVIPRLAPKGGANLEVECRFMVDERRGERVYGARPFGPQDTETLAKYIIQLHLKKKSRCEVEQVINLLGQDGAVKQLVFLNGVQQKDKASHYTKTRVIQPIIVQDKVNYKIALSYETPFDPFPTSACEKARVKLRFSAYEKNWRFDLTLARNLETLANPRALKPIKDSMFFPLKPEEFIERAPWGQAEVVEFEAEYIGDLAGFLPEEFPAIARTFMHYADDVRRDEDPEEADGDAPPNDYQAALYRVALAMGVPHAKRFRRQLGIKQLSNQVIDLNKNMFLTDVFPNIDQFIATPKIDGDRAMLLLDDQGVHSVSNEYKSLSEEKQASTSVIDSEKYGDVHYPFDPLVWQDQNLTGDDYGDRQARLAEVHEGLSETKGITLGQKPFVRLTKDGYRKQIGDMLKAKYPYKTDGIILNPVSGNYKSMVVYKVKPVEQQSADFLIRRCPKKLLGTLPYVDRKEGKLYLLFCGVRRDVFYKLRLRHMRGFEDLFPKVDPRDLPDYFPIQFETSDRRYAYLFWGKQDDLDGSVGEFIVKKPTTDPLSYEWELQRIREDRKVELARGTYFGNDYKTIEYIWMNYQDPLVIESFTPDASYFAVSDSALHKPSRNFNSFVKSQIFAQFPKDPAVLDMASGKGQDLFRYAKQGVASLLCLEIDPTALSELITRKHDYSRGRSRERMAVHVARLDLNKPAAQGIKRIEASGVPVPLEGFDLIVCNFALHYLIGSPAAVKNVATFVKHYLKPKGRFVFTAFDGAAVVDLLEHHPTTSHGADRTWESKTPEKFRIIKDYKGATLRNTGQKIKVLLPFSNQDYYTESLVNIGYLEAVFEKAGLVLETDESFGQYLADYKRANPAGYQALDEDDKTYVGLYHHYAFYRTEARK
jgi:SAM-dependent methyltransferase